MAESDSAPIAAPPAPPPPSDPRFSLELEFVLSLANPYYLSHLAVTYPNLLVGSPKDSKDDENAATTEKSEEDNDNADARAFGAYLRYLYSYWSRPEYVQFLTHPRGTLRALGLLQNEEFRRAVIRPDVIEVLLTIPRPL
ncbi:suppressor of hpr1 [Ascosphaera atra]|nr:suppressor of hpr1 [Ascosphaera atra]